MITTRCNCGGVFEFPDSAAGQSFRCGNCGMTMVVPKPSLQAPPAPVRRSPPPAAPSPFGATPTAAPPPLQHPVSSGSGGCVKVIVTLLIVTTVAVVLLIGGFYWVRGKVRQAANQISGWTGLIAGIEQLGNIDQVAQGYEDRGFRKVTGQVITETDPIGDKRLYMCQMLELKSDVTTDLAILAQAATIHGTVHGDLDFMGQALVIEKDAVIKGNVNSRLAQLISVKGVIEGQLTGGYQALDAPASRIKGGTTGTQEAISKIGTAISEAKRAADEKQRQARDPVPVPAAVPSQFDAKDFPLGMSGTDYTSDQKIQQFVDHFVALGYRRSVEPGGTNTIDAKTVFQGQLLRIRGDAASDLAAVGQSIHISGTIDGDLDLMGQAITIERTAVIKGNVRIHCAQVVEVDGRVEGQLSGTYQVVRGAARVRGGVVKVQQQ